MKFCELSPDDYQYCSCLREEGGRLICDIYDELIEDLKKCPLK